MAYKWGMALTRKQLAKKLAGIAESIQRLAEELDAAASEAKEVVSITCLQCGVETKTPRRGCCPTCYQRTYQRIRRGQMTEAEAVEAGLLSPQRSKGGRKPSKKTALDEYLATKGRRSGADAEALADQLVEDAEELQAVDSAKKAPRKKGRRRGKAAQKGE